ncbi:unnamed protein product [Ixodes hexagonus]
MSGSRTRAPNNSSSPDLASVFSRTQRENLELRQRLEMSEAHGSRVLEEQVLKGEHQTSVSERQSFAEVESLNSKMSLVQDLCCKFEKTNVEVSTRITDLTTRIVQGKAAELNKINNIRKCLWDLQQAVAETISNPECRDRLVASLTAHWKELEADSVTLDRKEQCAEEATLRKAKDESSTTDDANVAL